MWRYAVAHAGEHEAGKDVTPLIVAALPLWSEFKAEGALQDMSVDSPIGSAQMHKVYESVGGAGVSKAGRIGLDLSFDNLTVKSAALPPWSAQLTPATVRLSMAMSDSALGKAAGILLNDPHFGVGDISPKTSEAAKQANKNPAMGNQCDMNENRAMKSFC